MNPYYQMTDTSLWTGRTTDPKDGIQYWYQTAACLNWEELSNLPTGEKKIGLIGYANDEGVRRNQGRVGAKEGPKAIRHQLGKIAWHHKEINVLDFGDAICNDGDMEATQNQLAEVVEFCLRQNIFPLVLGGGHDIAYGHFKGIHSAIGNQTDRIGIINFDAHFDLRPVVQQGNSGTPFNQILNEYDFQQIDYMAIGIQQQANTKSLFDIAEQFGVQYIFSQDCHLAKAKKVKEKLGLMLEKCDALYITIDMDGFSSAYVLGVSAPSPLGFEPYFVMEILSFLFASEKVVSCDWAELNPRFDQDNASAKLVARLVDHTCSLI